MPNPYRDAIVADGAGNGDDKRNTTDSQRHIGQRRHKQNAQTHTQKNARTNAHTHTHTHNSYKGIITRMACAVAV